MSDQSTVLTHRTRTNSHAQEKCLIFTLPRELRDMIWIYVSTAYDGLPYSISVKPASGNSGLSVYSGLVEADSSELAYGTHEQLIETAFLSTCCRIYQEARRFPVQINEHVFKYVTYPEGSDVPSTYFRRMDPEQRLDASRMRILLGLSRYDDCDGILVTDYIYLLRVGHYGLNRSEAMQNIKILTMSIDAEGWNAQRRKVWNAQPVLAIDFRNNSCTVEETTMKENAINDRAGTPTPIHQNSLAAKLRDLGSLQRFNFIFEAYGGKRDELDVVCDHAKAWELPLSNGRLLKVNDPPAAATQRRIDWAKPGADDSRIPKDETCIVRRMVSWVATDGGVAEAVAPGGGETI